MTPGASSGKSKQYGNGHSQGKARQQPGERGEDAMLTPEQTLDIQKLLQERETELRAKIHQEMQERLGRDVADLEASAGDDSEQSIADLQEVMDTHELTRHADELQEIETAKEGLVNGRLGVCILCQRPIGYQRMLVHPVAQRCLACQELQERAGGNQNDNTV